MIQPDKFNSVPMLVVLLNLAQYDSFILLKHKQALVNEASHLHRNT